MEQVYRISAQRLEGIAGQARRLSNSTGKLTPEQIQQRLEGITLDAGLSLFDTFVTGKLPFLARGSAVSESIIHFATDVTGSVLEENT